MIEREINGGRPLLSIFPSFAEGWLWKWFVNDMDWLRKPSLVLTFAFLFSSLPLHWTVCFTIFVTNKFLTQ